MTTSTPDHVVVTYEDDEARNRSSYRFKLLLLLLLPYAYVFTVLAVIFAVFGLLLWTIITGQGRDGAILRIEIALAVVAALLLRSIWVRVPPPKGVTLPERQSTSVLLQTTSEIARAIRGPKFHAIIWTDEYEVSITPVPRLSLLGWPLRYYLKIGLPVMHALSPEQFRARVAHELGLFAGAHGRFRSWLYRHWFSWLPVLSVLTTRGRWGSWLFSRFYAWYVHFFVTYAQTAARYHTYEADRCAAEVTSPEVVAEALIRIDYGAYLENESWDEDFEKADKESDSYTYIANLLKQPLALGKEQEWLERTSAERTYDYQVRPELKDRLAVLGQTAHVPAPITQSAAEAYVADDLREVTERLDHVRQERCGPRWSEPDNTSSTEYDTGAQLLREDQEEGVALLERAMELDHNLITAACTQLSAYYHRKGDFITAESYSRRSTLHWQLFENAVAERTQVSFVETFFPHNFSDWEIQQLRSELAKHKGIKEAYLVRKKVTYFSEHPLHALSLVMDRGWFSKTAADISFAKRLPPARKHPPELYTFVLDHKNRRVGNIIRNVPNSLIYKNSSQNDETK